MHIHISLFYLLPGSVNLRKANKTIWSRRGNCSSQAQEQEEEGNTEDWLSTCGGHSGCQWDPTKTRKGQRELFPPDMLLLTERGRVMYC